jgi:hypothetical protein
MLFSTKKAEPQGPAFSSDRRFAQRAEAIVSFVVHGSAAWEAADAAGGLGFLDSLVMIPGADIGDDRFDRRLVFGGGIAPRPGEAGAAAQRELIDRCRSLIGY